MTVEVGRIYNEDCLETMRRMEESTVDTIITDPPYGLEFMGKGWDKGVPGVEFWQSALRVAKPGAMLLAFGGTRTYHRLTCAIEDAGWEIRDCLMWLYGSGFPKSLDISKAIDKKRGAKREVVGVKLEPNGRNHLAEPRGVTHSTVWGCGQGGLVGKEEKRLLTAPSTDLAKQWNGWGTSLKPAYEPIILAMKPCCGTFAENAEQYGVAGLNIEGGRIGTAFVSHGGASGFSPDKGWNQNSMGEHAPKTVSGRWPANVIHDGSEEVLRGFPRTGVSQGGRAGHDKAYCGGYKREHYGDTKPGFGDSGSASRFFYCAKASRSERGEGNIHPTVKPLALMEYLCTLTKTPTGGVVYDPFTGSGSTLVACVRTGRPFIGSELNKDYAEIAQKRIEAEQQQMKLAM